MNEQHCYYAFGMFCVTAVICLVFAWLMVPPKGSRMLDGWRDAFQCLDQAKGFWQRVAACGIIVGQTMKGGALGAAAVLVGALGAGLNAVCNFLQLPQAIDAAARLLVVVFNFLLRLLGKQPLPQGMPPQA